MICPECGEEITTLRCYSECVQDCSIDAEGNAFDFGSPEVLTGNEVYECPECGADVTSSVCTGD